MSSPQSPDHKRRPWLWTTAAVAVVAVVTTGAVLADGYDEQEVPRLEPSVWVTRDDGRYARVNTELGEIDTVKAVGDPAGVAQSGARGVIFTQGYAQAWPIDAANPLDLVDGSDGQASAAASRAGATPAGTVQVRAAAQSVLYRTAAGEVYLGNYPAVGESMPSPWQLNPYADVEVAPGEDAPTYLADAVALDDHGTVALFSLAEQAVRIYDAGAATYDETPYELPGQLAEDSTYALALAGGRWVLLDTTNGLIWIEGIEGALSVELGEAPRLQSTSSDFDYVLIADDNGLVRVDTVEGTAARIVEATGTATAPVISGGTAYAAWVTTAQATLWDSGSGQTTALETDSAAFEDVQTPNPVIRTNGDRAVLTETVTGSIWTLPDGVLLPHSDWEPLEDVEEVTGEVDIEDIVEQEPPVAVDDVFGVRTGSLVSLPVLYNDFDPNASDVLSIVPATVTELSESDFGEVSLVSQDQEAVIAVTASEGSATFTYSVTDGYTVSDPATVTLNVIPDDQNSAPEWCGVEDCNQEWPRPQVLPGGFTEVPVLRGWVDPEGDTFVLANAQADQVDAPVNVVPTADGKVAIRHLDPNGSADVIPITVTVVDSWGAEATRTLELHVTADPQLNVEPITINGSVGLVSRVDIADHVSGGSGSYRLVDAAASHGDEGVTITPLTPTGSVELNASLPGRYLATYTVEDTRTLTQSSATLRYTVTDEDRALTIPPLTTFVRAQEDATVDVLAAAQNTSGRVLMVAEATTQEPRLSASVVGTSFVRVSGTTESGEPGLIGVANVTIADGAGNTATTQLSVFLLPPTESRNPIAMPDTASVRVGSHIDIPVLDNDTSPRGERLMLMPEIESSGTHGELAFGSGKVLRYLAPTTPGTYTVRYTAYVESDVERTDSSAVTITVVPAGANQAPEPPPLTARVLVGQTVRIPFSGTGVDPDGDAVTLVNVTQPPASHGSASVSAGGGAIIYRAPIRPVQGGQVTFEYSVMDEHGLTASARVRVGVLDTDISDVAPVTYSDYVAAHLDSPTAIPVEPLRNDSDPLQGELTVVDVRPYATAGTAEYNRLEALFDRRAYEQTGVIKFLPGSVAGTHSYVYTAESSVSLSTAEGRIVVDVSETANPSSLQVQDTVLTARTRHDLATGIDVVSGKVQWQGGDVGSLTLSLLDSAPAGFTSSGWVISGSFPDQPALVPFSLTGTDDNGDTATTYGFLRIPAFDNMRVQPGPDITPVDVEEDSTVTFEVRNLLDIAPADTLELRADESFAVQRDNAHCTATSGTSVSYSAGREAPWSDTCSIVVRLGGQESWSVVAIPITVAPLDPQAILNPISRTIRPAQHDTVNLIDELVTWEGGRVGDTATLGLTTSYSGSSFEVSTAGGILTATARADAVPGTREVVHVTSPAVDGLGTTITLVVGAAPADSPRGATFSHSCDVSAGSQCTITVTGIAGEYDPFAGAAGSGLTLVAVGGGDSVSCSVATVTRASDSQVVATWPSGHRPEGGECVVNFTVADAQGRTGHGTLNLDVQGYPRAPSSLTTASFTGTSVTLEVNLGPAAQAHPSVTSVVILRGGSPVSADCAPARSGTYRCTVSGLENGAQATYTARAVNAVGESPDTSGHTTWAYQAPEITSVSAESVYVPGETTTTRGFANITVASSADTRAFRIEGREQEETRRGHSTTFRIPLEPGNRTVRVMPLSQFEPPTDGMSTGSTVETQVVVIGAPSYVHSGITAHDSEGSITVNNWQVDPNFAKATDVTQKFYAWPKDTARPACSMVDGRAHVSGGATSNSNVITSGLDANITYSVAVCSSNRYGVVDSNAVTVFNWVKPAAPQGNTSYRIDPNPARSSENPPVYAFRNFTPPSPQSRNHMDIYYRYKTDGGAVHESLKSFRLPQPGETVWAAYCAQSDPGLCGDETQITASGAPHAVTVTFPGPKGVDYGNGQAYSGCYATGDFDYYLGKVEISPNTGAEIKIGSNGQQFVVENHGGSYSGLRQIRHDFDVCPDYVPEPEPTPAPSPEPGP